MSTLALTNTLTAGTPEDIADVQQNFTDIVTWANGNVGTDNLAANTLVDADFASTAGMYTAYRTLLVSEVVTPPDIAAGTYFFRVDPAAPTALTTAATDWARTDTTVYPPMMKYLDDADYAISGRTTKLRLRAQVSTNGTVPAITFTFGLYPVTFSGAADVLTMTLGTVVSGSTVAIASPTANSTTAGTPAVFTFPSDGLYALGVVTSAQLTNNNASLLTAELQQNWT